MLARRMRTMPLHVFDCKLIEETGTDRPDGFPDYQLFICVSGKGIIKDVSGAEQQMKAGDIMYIPSFAGHCYYPASAEPWMIKYISFNGLSIPDGFLDALGMPEHICIWSGMPHYAELHALFQRIAEAYAERSYIDDLSMYALLYRLLYTLFLDTHSTPPVAGGEGSVPAAVLRYIETHLDAELSVNSVAEATQTTVYFLYKSFKATFGTTPWEYILSRRLELARQLLVSDSSLTLRDIGLMTGMPSKNYLNRRFKSEYGMTPGEYRKMHLARSGVQNDFTKKALPVYLTDAYEETISKDTSLDELDGPRSYELFFCSGGCGIVTDEYDTEHFIRPGHICFFMPDSECRLRPADVDWRVNRIRFGGRHIKTLLKGLGLFGTTVIHSDAELTINHRFCADTVYNFADSADAVCGIAWDTSRETVIKCSVLLYEFIIFSGIAANDRYETSSEEEQLAPVVDIINMYYQRRLLTEELADAIGVTPNRLRQLFKIVFKTSVKDYITEVRLSHAKRLLLRHPNKGVGETARETGFSGAGHFISCFKAREGITPEEYRRIYSN